MHGNDDGSGKVSKQKTKFGQIGEIVGALTGDAKPHRLEDHHGMLPGKATIIADEGYKMADNSNKVGLQHQTYIIDLHPDNGDPAVRAEIQCWVSWTNMPRVGDVVAAGYKKGGKDITLLLGGDRRYDWVMQAASAKSNAKAERDALLQAGPDSDPHKR